MGLTKIKAKQISNLDYKQSCRVYTATSVTLAGGAPLVVDNVTLQANDRILVANQSNRAQNGIYRVQTAGSGSNGTWVRTTDADQTGEVLAGMIVMVTEGTVYKDTQWKLITNDPIVIGVSELDFELNSAFAFGNIWANGTAVIANTVGDAVTFTAGNNISIIGNADTQTLTFSVTGISLNSISNGTSNVTVVESGGNVIVGVNGNTVSTFTENSLIVAGAIVGNGSQLTGIDTFKTISVAGQSNVVADSIADTLTLAAGNGIVIVTDAGNDIITIAAVGAGGDSIFATGGDMGTVDQPVTSEENLGLVTGSVTQEYNLGTLSVDGVVTNQNIADGSLTGNKFAPDTDLATTGNLSVGNLQVTGTLAFDTVDTNALIANTANINGTINVAGNIIPTANVTYDLGTSSLRWRDLYLSGNTIALGDIVIKDSGAGQIGFFQSNGTTPASIDPNNVDTSQIANANTRVAVVAANGNIVATVNSGQVAVISATGISSSNLSATGNVSAAAVTASGNVSAAGMTATNITASGNVSSLFNFSQRTITANTTIGNVNASSAGPIIIAEGVTVTVSTGGEWSIV